MDNSSGSAGQTAMLFDDMHMEDTRLNRAPAPEARFDDGKDPEALRTIGEVAKALDIRPHVLRYWEEQFPDLKPIKRSGNRRYYRPEDVALIGEIDRLVHREGYTLKGAAKAIVDKLSPDAASIPDRSVNNSDDPVSDEFFDRLAAIRRELATALTAA